MSYFSDNLQNYEAARGAGEFGRVIETIDSQSNPANALVLRALARAAELGDIPEARISQMVAGIVDAAFVQESSIGSHSDSHEAGVSIGGGSIPFLPGWTLNIDLHAPEQEWPITSLDTVDKIEFMLYPQVGEHDDGPEYTDDLLCNFAPSVFFTRSITNQWVYDRLNSSLELNTQAEVLDFVAGLSQGVVTPE